MSTTPPAVRPREGPAPAPPASRPGGGRVWVLTDRTQVPVGRTLVDVVAELAGALPGLTVVLREKDRPRAERRALALDLAPVVRAAAGRLLVASDADLAAEVGADGVHLAQADPYPADPYPAGGAAGRPTVVGRSCHSAGELRAAAAEGCDHALLSPVFATASKPGYGPALGLDGLAGAVDDLRRDGIGLPVVALGGIEPSAVAACLAAGASAVAVMGSAMRSPERWRAIAAEAAAVAGNDADDDEDDEGAGDGAVEEER